MAWPPWARDAPRPGVPRVVNRDGVGWEAIEVSMCLGIGVGAQRGMGGENVNKVLGELKLAIRSGGRRNRGFYDALLSRDGDALAEGFWGDHWKEIKIKKKVSTRR